MISSIRTALSALQAFARKSEATAHNVANAATDGFKSVKVTLSEEAQGVSARVRSENVDEPQIDEQNEESTQQPEPSTTDLAQEMTDNIITSSLYKANIKTIRTGDDMLGTVIDIKK